MPPPQSAICQCISASVLFLHSTHNCASRPPQPCRKQQKTEKQKRTGWNRCSPDTTWDKGARGNESSPPSVETHCGCYICCKPPSLPITAKHPPHSATFQSWGKYKRTTANNKAILEDYRSCRGVTWSDQPLFPGSQLLSFTVSFLDVQGNFLLSHLQF